MLLIVYAPSMLISTDVFQLFTKTSQEQQQQQQQQQEQQQEQLLNL